jgi:hypothetical protein
VALWRYDLAEHQVWALDSVVVVIGLIAATVLNVSTPGYRDDAAAATRARGLLVLAGAGAMQPRSDRCDLTSDVHG